MTITMSTLVTSAALNSASLSAGELCELRSHGRSYSTYDVNANIPEPNEIIRSVSCNDVGSTPSTRGYRLNIWCADDKLRMRMQQTAKQLLTTVADSSSSCTNALLAKKALKHRKILERMGDVDVHDPTFDASKFLGVSWTKHTEACA